MSKIFDFDKISAHEGPQASPGYLLWRTSTKWRSAIENVLKQFDLTHPQFVILASIGWLTRKGNNVSQAEIGKMAGLDPNTTSQILRGLEAKNFIKRIRSSDERSKNPVLTDLGSKNLNKALPAVEIEDAKFFSVLNSKEHKELIKIFNELISK